VTRRYDAIVLAGGRSSRMAGRAKAQLRVGDATMLEHVLGALHGAMTRVVVGPPQSALDGVLVVQEHPAGSGPVAGLAAGLPHLSSDVVVVVAADLPFLTPELIEALVAGLGETVDVVLSVDENGRDQYLLGAWRVDRLNTALAELEPLPGRAMKELLRVLQVSRAQMPAPSDFPAPWTDIDTPADLARARDAVQAHCAHSPDNARSAPPRK